ncbi:hypothetical protein AB0C98_35670 [Streptomyces sp. NPDC048558]|uniref:hypothetical protein n=1 Tax=Streptomyces sp. NPDC048558 TaxID=3155759 RepID=UPI00343C9190
MSRNTSPQGLALLLITLGSLASMAGAAAFFATDEHFWRFLIAAGCFVHFLGWVRHGARRRGGVR